MADTPNHPCPACGTLMVWQGNTEVCPLMHDAAAMFPPPPVPKILTPTELSRLGAVQPEFEKSKALDTMLREQRETYKEHSRADLIDALIDRDRQLIVLGQQIADGRMAGRLLREAMRVVLTTADHASLVAVERGQLTGGKAATIENLLRMLGAEPADNRELRLHGHTLGTGQSPEEAEAAIDAPDRVPQPPSDRVGEAVREHRDEHVAKDVTPEARRRKAGWQ